MPQFIEKTLDRLAKLDLERVRRIIRNLHRDHQRLEEVINSLPDGIVVLDERHRPLLRNRAARLLLPLNAHNADAVVWDGVGDEQIARYLRQVLQERQSEGDDDGVRRGGGARGASFSLGRAGSLRTLQLELLPLVRRRRIVGNILYITDITELLATESRLQRAEQLASLTHLTANVAHEIKNPLAAISIYIQLIKRELLRPSPSSPTPPTIDDHLRIIEEEIDRLNKIVVDFLFSVRPIELALEEVEMHTILDEVLTLFRPELQDARIALTTRFANHLPLVEIDAGYLKQAIMNIIKNAIEAVVSDGAIEIRTAAADGGVRVEIIDNGSGVAERDLGRVFDPYFTTKDEGSGIGLTQTYKIIHEHRGEISIANNRSGSNNRGDRAGVTVTITLPLPRARQKLIGSECGDDTDS